MVAMIILPFIFALVVIGLYKLIEHRLGKRIRRPPKFH